MTKENGAANAEQIQFWNSVAGPRWVKRQALLDIQLEDLGVAAMEAGNVGAGASVLDVGCGCGATTLTLARRVGAEGRALGLDISAPMLDLARDRAQRESIANATFECADAQVHEFSPQFDLVFSRFGVMFFDDPVAAFTNLHGALRDGGRLSFVCWQSAAGNPWMSVPMMAALRHVNIDLPASPEAPGPFAFADSARVEGILAKAGFRDIALRGLQTEMLVGGGTDLDETVRFMLEMGPVSRVVGDAPPALLEAVSRDIAEVLTPYVGPDGSVRMSGSVWIATAQK